MNEDELKLWLKAIFCVNLFAFWVAAGIEEE